MTSPRNTELVPTLVRERKERRAAFLKNARRAGVLTVAAAFGVSFALPAFASQNETNVAANSSLQALVSRDAQDLQVEQTAGLPGIEAITIDATSPQELEALRAEIAAEEEAAQAAEEKKAADAVTEASSTTSESSEAGATSQAGTTAETDTATTQTAGLSGSAIANAAIAQLGEIQSCTQLVADSLAAVGVKYTGMGGLFNLGPTISQSQATPGDIIYYANGGFGIAHVAVYIGNGQAVHGGWSGNQTVIAGVNIGGSAPVFIDVA